MDSSPGPSREVGATLIEVMVSVAVCSIGLLGMAGLLSVSASANHSAYQNTQADLAAQALIDSMHVNAAAVAGGGYDGALDATTATAIDCGKQGCAAPQRAAHDRARFVQALAAVLPNAKASLRCDASAVCRLEMDGSQRALVSTDKASGAQALVWVFAP